MKILSTVLILATASCIVTEARSLGTRSSDVNSVVPQLRARTLESPQLQHILVKRGDCRNEANKFYRVLSEVNKHFKAFNDDKSFYRTIAIQGAIKDVQAKLDTVNKLANAAKKHGIASDSNLDDLQAAAEKLEDAVNDLDGVTGRDSNITNLDAHASKLEGITSKLLNGSC
ncbi:hypothetical protein BGX29_011216 [Mortierella sp. GBA35]|nr:hypothetical protein BGX29_011216 [Mortierella sp. GBA35]